MRATSGFLSYENSLAINSGSRTRQQKALHKVTFGAVALSTYAYILGAITPIYQRLAQIKSYKIFAEVLINQCSGDRIFKSKVTNAATGCSPAQYNNVKVFLSQKNEFPSAGYFGSRLGRFHPYYHCQS
jgi:hypothetical protein